MDMAIREGLAEARALARQHWQALLTYVGLGVVLPFLLLSSEPIFDLRTSSPSPPIPGPIASADRSPGRSIFWPSSA
jgi:hypothetical protein